MLRGFAGDLQLEGDGTHFSGMISELLGHLGSSEGYPYILRSVGAAYASMLERLKVIIPASFGTAVVPLSLDVEMDPLVIACLCPRLCLIKKLPFDKLQLPCPYGPSVCGLPNGHLLMELYDSMEILKGGMKNAPAMPHVRECEWTVRERWRIWGFGLYLVYGDTKTGPFYTSDCSHRRVGGCNWMNLFIPLGEPFQCLRNDKIKLKCTSHTLEKAESSYEWEVSILRRGSREFNETLRFKYNDIVCAQYKYSDLQEHCNRPSAAKRATKKRRRPEVVHKPV